MGARHLAAAVVVGLLCLLAGRCGGPSPGPDAAAPELPAAGQTPDGALFVVHLAPSLEPIGPGGRLTPAWCPRVELRYPSGRRTHGAVGCRALRAHVPTGGYVIVCRSREIFILLLTTGQTSSVAVEASRDRTVVLTPYRAPAAGLDGRLWLAHYPGRTSPRAVISTEGHTRYRLPYPTESCLDAGATNGLLGR